MQKNKKLEIYKIPSFLATKPSYFSVCLADAIAFKIAVAV